MRSTRRIGLLLTLVFLLPALFFSVYELSSLNKDERMIQQIYSKQLEAILFSVNQYSDDILSNWTARIQTGLHEQPGEDEMPRRIKDLLLLNESIIGIFMIDSADETENVRLYNLSELDSSLWESVHYALKRDTSTIHQLFKYKRSGFQKMTRLNGGPSQNPCLVYVTENSEGRLRLAGLIIDPELFIQDIVGPRLQAVAQDQFVLTALVSGTDSTIYSTYTAPADTTNAQTPALTKEFWVFPEYVLGITTKGETLQQLIHERTRVNFILLASLDIILIIAVILVFRNLKREVDLAQNKADFVSNVSHEIRTPLALISMFAETLEMGRVASEEKKKEYYHIISKETQRLTGIVNRILNFSQTEAKQKVLHAERVNLSHTVKNILDTYDFHLRNKGFDYTLSLQDDVWVQADKEAIKETVINLVDNAMKYSEEKKFIKVTTGRSTDFGYIAIQDEGVGISAKDQKHIFDKFYRVQKGNLARANGTGLGLSLVKQLVDEQGGKITVDSSIGKGSTFTIHLPLD